MKYLLLKIVKLVLIITIFLTLESCQDVIVNDIEFDQLQILRNSAKYDTISIKLDTVINNNINIYNE